MCLEVLKSQSGSSDGNLNSSLTDVKQFYPNMKFNHNSISYNFDASCDQTKQDKMLQAFDDISSQVGYISFYYDPNNPDIEILCSEDSEAAPTPNGSAGDYFIAGEGGSKEIIETGRYNVINQGVVLFYGDVKNSLSCDQPNVEIHELMHVFGFNHSVSKDSIMYPVLLSCNQKLDDSIINQLKALYSQQNLPDLYFENISVIKKGRYLDFNFTIKNSGDVDANNVDYSIFDEDSLVETRHIGNIKYGAGLIIAVENLKLIHRDPSEIKFVIDNNNTISEIDKNNNVAIVNLNASSSG